MARCRGNLDCELNDFEIFETTAYNGKNRVQNPMDDSLVPYISHEKSGSVAKEFLKVHYPEALTIQPKGRPAVWVDPTVLAKEMGLKIKLQRIREDASVFGQIYFEDADVEMYDKDTKENALIHIEGKTIVVDPQMFLLRNLGSVNNTIVHECVHWDLKKL